MDNSNDKEKPINAPVPVNSGTELKSFDTASDDVMIVSDGELPAHAGEVLPDKPRHVTHINGGEMDESMAGGYASVNGKERSSSRQLWIVIIVMTIMCLAVGVCSAVLTGYFMRTGGAPPTIQTESKYEDISAVIKTRKSCIVNVKSGSNVRGSGIVTKYENGKIYILTNYHVLEGGMPYEVKFQGGENPWVAECIGYDEFYDVAVLTLSANTAPYEVYDLDGSEYFSRAAAYCEGDIVVAIGNSLGNGIVSSEGIISHASELLNYRNKTVPVLRTTAAINGGMSGGGLFDTDGNLIGMGTYRVASSEVGYNPNDPNSQHYDPDWTVYDTFYAIPVSVLYPVYRQILEYGNTGSMVTITPRTTASSEVGELTLYFEDFGKFTAEYKNGRLTVMSLDNNIPPASIQKDDVIVGVSNSIAPESGDDSKNNVCSLCGDLLCYRYKAYKGAALKLIIDRNGTELTVTVDSYYQLVS